MHKSVLDVEKVMTQFGYNTDKIQHVIAHVIHGKVPSDSKSASTSSASDSTRE